jgi:hypothetical protein
VAWSHRDPATHPRSVLFHLIVFLWSGYALRPALITLPVNSALHHLTRID